MNIKPFLAERFEVYQTRKLIFLTILMVLGLSGCASFPAAFEDPKVQLVSIERLPGSGMRQGLMVVLNVQNPNSYALPIQGMSYGIDIEGYEIANGITSEIADIPAYGETQVSLPVTADLMQLVRLMSGLMVKGDANLEYRLGVKIDVNLPLVPDINLTESGSLPLAALR